jgi:hypothetical protein
VQNFKAAKIEVFVPPEALENVKKNMHAADLLKKRILIWAKKMKSVVLTKLRLKLIVPENTLDLLLKQSDQHILTKNQL